MLQKEKKKKKKTTVSYYCKADAAQKQRLNLLLRLRLSISMPVSGIFARARGSMALPRPGDSRRGMLGAGGGGKAPPCKGLGAQGDFSLPGRSQVSHVCCPGGGWHSAVWPSAALCLDGTQTLIHLFFFFSSWIFFNIEYKKGLCFPG